MYFAHCVTYDRLFPPSNKEMKPCSNLLTRMIYYASCSFKARLEWFTMQDLSLKGKLVAVQSKSTYRSPVCGTIKAWCSRYDICEG